jgi:uncharacterized membrane protein YgdD (TMEM256/DUF423 family)
MAARLAAAAALAAATAVAAGAFGAHALAGRLDARGLELWRTADRYLALAAVGALAMAALAGSILGGRGTLGGWILLAGGALFAATLCGLALGGPRWLGAVTPLGGAAMIAGFVLFALAALRGATP